MDPKATTSVLDPKLKEAYDRVMATAVPPPVQPTTPQPQAPTPASPAGGPPPPPIVPPPQPVAPPAASATIVGAIPKKNAKSLRLFPLLFAIGGLLFFVVYTIFWLKFFNLSVPFLPF